MWILLTLLACNGKSAEDSDATDSTVTSDDTAIDTTDTSPPTDSEVVDTGSAVDTDTGTAVVIKDPVADLSAELHEIHKTMIYASWTQLEEAPRTYVEYSVDEGVWQTSPVLAREPGPQRQIVVGVPYDHDVTWRVVSEAGEQRIASEDQVITTGPHPEGLPHAEVDISSPDAWDPADRFLLTSTTERDAFEHSTAEYWMVILDRQGRVVWSKPTPRKSWTLFAKPARDGGAILHDESYYWTAFDGGVDSLVHRIKLDDTVERTWATPGLHHSFDDLSEDTIAWMGQDGLDDYLYLSEGEGSGEVLWECLAWLDEENIYNPGEGSRNYCGANAIQWYEPRDSYVISLFSHETVLELDPDVGVRWFVDRPGGKGLTLPANARWEWQHDAQLIEDDRLLLSSGVRPNDGPFPGAGGYDHSAVYEYEIDVDAGELTLVWEHHSEPEWVSLYKGGTWRLENGNTTHYLGDFPGFKEVTSDGEVVWQFRFVNEEDPWIGRSTFIEDLYPMAE